MVYINSRGQIEEKRALSWSTPIDLLLAFINFIIVFFQTLLPIGSNDTSNRRSNRGGGGGGGGGNGPGGGPKGPRIRTLGSCGGPNAPPAGGG